METIVAIIKKDNGGDVRVRIDELYGHRFVDIRHFTEVGPACARKFVATKKGIAVPPELVPQIIKALQEAVERLNGDDAPFEVGTALVPKAWGQASAVPAASPRRR